MHIIYEQYSSDTTYLLTALIMFVFVACGSFSGSFIEYFAHDMSKFCHITFIDMAPQNEN